MWIRIDTDIATNRKTLVLRTSCGRPTPTIVGHLTMLLSRLADNESDGYIGDLPAEVIEEWAGWDGEPGMFDRAFRESFVTDGVIDGWEERQGTLMARQRKDRERKREERARKVRELSAGRPKDRVRTSKQNPDATVTVTVTDTTTTTATTSAAAAPVAEPLDVPAEPSPKRTKKPKPAPTGGAAVPPAENWLASPCAAWEKHFGAGSFKAQAKKAAGLLSPLKDAGLSPGDIGKRLDRYCAQRKAGYCTLADFAQHHGQYAPPPLESLRPINGEMSAELERETRPPGAPPPKYPLPSGMAHMKGPVS